MKYDRIEEISLSKNFSLGALAEKIGVTRAGLYRMIENQTMKVETLEKIAQVLDVPVCKFFETREDDLDEIPLIKEFLITQNELLILAMHTLFNARTTSLRLYEAVVSFKKALEDEKQAACFNHPAAKNLNTLIEMLSEDGKIYEIEKAVTKLSEIYMETSERKNEYLHSLEKKKQ